MYKSKHTSSYVGLDHIIDFGRIYRSQLLVVFGITHYITFMCTIALYRMEFWIYASVATILLSSSKLTKQYIFNSEGGSL